MGLLFAFLGKRNFNYSALIRFGVFCGAAPYLLGDGVNLLSHANWNFGPYLRQPVAEFIILGLPVVLILISRFFADQQN